VLGIIDAGNTQIKVAVFDKQQLLKHAVYKGFDANLTAFLQENLIKQVFVSSVVNIPEAFENNSNFTVTVLNHTHKTPINNAYKTPQTLGSDRLANACGAYVTNGNKGPVLAIDLGTCIKFDLVDAEGNYLGGSIAPGFEMRLKALNHFTQKLPLVEVNVMPNLIGASSNESIASGVVNGMIAEINGLIDQYERQFPSIKVFLTGGDAAFFLNSLKNNIFASPLLTLHGLNAIANVNGLN
jgi:type III pantothenate kinase